MSIKHVGPSKGPLVQDSGWQRAVDAVCKDSALFRQPRVVIVLGGSRKDSIITYTFRTRVAMRVEAGKWDASRYQYTPQNSKHQFLPSSRSAPSLLSDAPIGKSQPAAPQLTSEKAVGVWNAVRGLSKNDTPALWISGAALSTEDVANDFRYLVDESKSTLFANKPIAQSPVFQALGLMTAENTVIGPIIVYKALQRLRTAHRIGDGSGKIESGLDAVRGVVQCFVGIAFLGYRTTAMASIVKGVNYTSQVATTALGLSTFYLGVIGNVLLTGLYGIFGAMGAYQLLKGRQFAQKLDAQGSDQKAQVAFLIREATVNTKQHLKNVKTRLDPKQKEAYLNRLAKTGREAMGADLKQVLNMGIAEGVFDKKMLKGVRPEELLQSCLERIEEAPELKAQCQKMYLQKLGLNDEDVQGLELGIIELAGLSVLEGQRQEKKVNALTRMVGGGLVERIKKAERTGLIHRLDQVGSSAIKEAAELQKGVRKRLTSRKIINGGLVVMGAIGVTVSVALVGLFTLSPAAIAAMTALTFAMIFLMLGLDFTFWKTGMKEGAPGKFDKLFVLAASSVIVASLILGTALTFGFGFSITALVLAYAVGGIDLGFAGLSFYLLGKRAKKWKEDHPSIGILVEELNRSQQAPVNSRVKTLYHKLPKADRTQIRQVIAAGYDANQVLEAGKEEEITSALKKTAKEYWQRHAVSKEAKDLARAREIQQYYEGSRVKAMVLDELKGLGFDDELMRNLHYVAQKEDRAALQSAIQEMQEARTKAAKEQWGQIRSLVEKNHD